MISLHRSATSPAARPARRRAAALASAALVAFSFAGAASAAEVGTGGGGGGGGGVAVCSPVSSLTAKGDPRVGELGTSSIAVSYSVKPCDARPVTVTTEVSEYFAPANVAYSNPDAPLNGKFTVFGIRVRTSYRVTVSVLSAADGTVLGSSSVFAAAIPKGV